MITSKQILDIIEDFNANSYPVGNVSSKTYIDKRAVINKINNEKGYAEKVLDKIINSDYSYYINSRHNRIFSRMLNSKRPPSEQDINLLKQELTRRYVDIAKEVVNYYRIT